MQTKIIALANQKGGCGKTTITMQLAGALGLDKEAARVLVVDADPQGTAIRWAANAEDAAPFPATIAGLSAAGGKVHREIKKYLGQFDYILIDCPPAVDSPAPQSALMIADLVLIPVIPSPADLWAAVGIQALVERMTDLNEALKARLIANMCQSNTTLTKEASDVLNSFGIEKLESSLTLRTAYRQSTVFGGTVFDIKGADKAMQEISALKNEVLKILTI
jgi:chromosome partitioning protein